MVTGAAHRKQQLLDTVRATGCGPENHSTEPLFRG